MPPANPKSQLAPADYRVTSEQIDCYQADGAVPLRQVVSQSELGMIASAIDRDIAAPGPFHHEYEVADGELFHANLRLWQTDRSLRQICLASQLPGIARQFFDCLTVNLFYDHLFVKGPLSSHVTRWHNDQPYWPIRGWQVLSIWVALDETSLETGAVEFIRGSHRWNRWFQPEVFGKPSENPQRGYAFNPDYEPIPDIESRRDQYDIISWDLEPGDAYVFHGLTVHGSRGNLSSQRSRRGYVPRYVGEDVRYDTRPGTNRFFGNVRLKDGERLSGRQYPLIRFQ